MSAEDVISFLPDRVWYLTRSGRDMWCRRPYGFFFTSSDAATAFAREMSELDLEPIGVSSRELVSEAGLESLRKLEVTRVFVDPRIDPATGDVFGTILRIAAQA